MLVYRYIYFFKSFLIIDSTRTKIFILLIKLLVVTGLITLLSFSEVWHLFLVLSSFLSFTSISDLLIDQIIIAIVPFSSSSSSSSSLLHFERCFRALERSPHTGDECGSSIVTCVTIFNYVWYKCISLSFLSKSKMIHDLLLNILGSTPSCTLMCCSCTIWYYLCIYSWEFFYICWYLFEFMHLTVNTLTSIFKSIVFYILVVYKAHKLLEIFKAIAIFMYF